MNGKEKKGILLVTAGFPFGESEQSFLRAEFAQRFHKIVETKLNALNVAEKLETLCLETICQKNDNIGV